MYNPFSKTFGPIFQVIPIMAIISILIVSIFGNQEVYSHYDEEGKFWMNDYLTFKVRASGLPSTVAQGPMENVIIYVMRIEHEGHEHWADEYRGFIDIIPRGTAREVYTVSHYEASGDMECTLGADYKVEFVIWYDKDGEDYGTTKIRETIPYGGSTGLMGADSFKGIDRSTVAEYIQYSITYQTETDGTCDEPPDFSNIVITNVTDENRILPVGEIDVDSSDEEEHSLKIYLGNGDVIDAVANDEENILELSLETSSEDDGILMAVLDSSLIQSKSGENNLDFVVTLNGEIPAEFRELPFDDPSQRIIEIKIPPKTSSVEIHGSWVVPEFGTIAILILAITIISLIVSSSRTKLRIFPQNFN